MHVGDVRGVADVFLELGSLERRDDLRLTTGQENRVTEAEREKGATFPQAGEPVELHQAEVVPGDQHRGGMVGVYGVDLAQVGVLGPNAADLWSQDAAPGRPAHSLHFLLGDERLPHCRRTARRRTASRS